MRKLLCILLVATAADHSAAYGEEFKLYFGLMHGHTSFSDGSGTPAEAFTMARDAGLDFFTISEHNHKQAAGSDGEYLTPQSYGKLIHAARELTVPDSFLAIYGQEVSTISTGNHANIFFADQICDVPNGNFKDLYEIFLRDHPEIPFIQFNHPNVTKDRSTSTPINQRNNDYGIDDYDQDFSKLVAAAGKHAALIELIIGPAFSEHTDMVHQQGNHQRDYLFYLDKGFYLAPSAGQDNHKKTWGKATHARMGVWATRLTLGAFVDAIQARRCFASEDDNCSVWVTANGHAMGSLILPPADGIVRLRVAIEDPDEPDATYQIRIYYDNVIGDDEVAQVIDSQKLVGEGELEFTYPTEPDSYFFVKVTQSSEKIQSVPASGHDDDIWTAPIWIGGSGTTELVGSSNTDDPEKSRISWDEASDYVGQSVEVSGKIVRSFKFQDKAVFFNFDPDYENTLSLVVLKNAFPAFGGEEALIELQRQLTNKEVKVRGKITLYRDERLQILLQGPDQLVFPSSEPEVDE